MTGRLEWLLSLIGLQSATRVPVEVASTAPQRMSRQDAIAELSYALQGPWRLQVSAALLRWAPDMLSSGDIEKLRATLRDHVLLYALTQPSRLPDSKLPQAVVAVTTCAMREWCEWRPCSTCNGKGKVQEMRESEGVVEVQCPRCEGTGWRGWSTLKRARVMGIPWTTAARSRVQMCDYAAAQLNAWAVEGVEAVRRMATSRAFAKR